MSVKKVGPDSKTGFNYIACLDLVVFVCIVVIAGRPDGLAITVSAIIVAMLALLYRCTVGIKSYVSRESRPQAPAPKREAVPKAAVAPPAGPTEGRSSWLRESD